VQLDVIGVVGIQAGLGHRDDTLVEQPFENVVGEGEGLRPEGRTREGENLVLGEKAREGALHLEVQRFARDLPARKVAHEVLEAAEALHRPRGGLVVHDEDRQHEAGLGLDAETRRVFVDETDLAVGGDVLLGHPALGEDGRTAARVYRAGAEGQEENEG
jgi:hypothetical protein